MSCINHFKIGLLDDILKKYPYSQKERLFFISILSQFEAINSLKSKYQIWKFMAEADGCGH